MFLCCMYFEDLFFPACGHFVPHLCEAGKVWGRRSVSSSSTPLCSASQVHEEESGLCCLLLPSIPWLIGSLHLIDGC